MRVFSAVELAPSARRSVGRAISVLRRHAGFSGTSVRWVDSSNLHITVRFFGEMRAAELGQVAAVLAEPFPHTAFYVTLERYGLFPGRGSPRVVYLRVGEGERQLSALHTEVTQRVARFGLSADAKPFRAHVTIGRVKRARHADTPGIRSVLDTMPLDATRWLVDRVVLYESRLSSQGSTYHVLTRGSLRRISGE